MLKCLFSYSAISSGNSHSNFSSWETIQKRFVATLSLSERFCFLFEGFASLYLALRFLFYSPFPIAAWAGWGTSRRSGIRSRSLISGTALQGHWFFFSFLFSMLFERLLFCNLLVRFVGGWGRRGGGVDDAFAMFVFLPQNWQSHMIIWNSALGASSSSRVNIKRGRRGLGTRPLDVWVIENAVLVRKEIYEIKFTKQWGPCDGKREKGCRNHQRF